MKTLFALLAGLLVLASGGGSARCDELTIFTARAIATVLDVIGPQFEQSTAHKLRVVTGLSSELVKRIDDGEPFDILAAPPPVLDRLIKAGKLRESPRVFLTRSDVGVEVRAGAPKPDIQKDAAQSKICYVPSRSWRSADAGKDRDS